MRNGARISKFLSVAGVLAVGASAFADTPRPAQDIMSEATKTARAKHKPIFVLFDASW